MGKIEQKVNQMLNSMPHVRKMIKRIYQLTMYAFSKKIKSEGEIVKLSPGDSFEYFFGYYDKSPWNANNNKVVCLRVKNAYKNVAPADPAEIVIIDLEGDGTVEVLAKTSTWNVQQGCMLQWLGPDFNSKIIFNDFRDNAYCSVILDVISKEEKVIKAPVYSVSQDGKRAISLDFSRLHRLRKGYGYSNIEDSHQSEKCPDSTAVWEINIETGEVTGLLKYTDFFNFEQREEMINAEHKLNHAMLSPSGNKFMVLHRWQISNKKYTRLLTYNIITKKLYNLSDDDMTSHCSWKNENQIIGFLRKKKEGNGYFLLEDNSTLYKHMWDWIVEDGHPSYSPKLDLLVTDTYPNRSRMSSLKILTDDGEKVVARVFSPFRYDNDVRCDLHPRWNRDGSAVCFDAVFEGKRGLYKVDISIKTQQ